MAIAPKTGLACLVEIGLGLGSAGDVGVDKNLGIGFGSHAATRYRNLAANATEILGPGLRPYGALEIEDGDPISKMQSQ
jgi:hypothetical protein